MAVTIKPQAVGVSSPSGPNWSCLSPALFVRLEAFEGPLDLLLHRVRKQDIDITTIPITPITRRYLDSLSAVATLDLETAGDFLVLAATLLYIKSKTLLPPDETEIEVEDVDPRAELAQRVIEYQQYKEAAEEFSQLQARWRLVYTRPRTEPEEEVISLRRVSVLDLLGALKTVLDNVPESNPMEIAPDEETVEQRSLWLLGCLDHTTPIPFVDLFGPRETRLGIIMTFLALLELIRRGLVAAVQHQVLGPILLVRTAGAAGS